MEELLGDREEVHGGRPWLLLHFHLHLHLHLLLPISWTA
jgi:hypothetical protein